MLRRGGSLGIVIFQVTDLGIGARRHLNLRDVVSGFGNIEVRFVLLIVGGDLRVGNINMRDNIFINKLRQDKVFAYLLAQSFVVQALLLELLLKLFRGIGAFQLPHFGVDLRFRSGDPRMGSVHDQDLIVDEFIQDIQLETGGLFGGGGVCALGRAAAVEPLHLLTVNGLAVNFRPNLLPGCGLVSAARRQQA